MKRFIYCIGLVFAEGNKNWRESGGWPALFRELGTAAAWILAAAATLALAGWFSYLTVGLPENTRTPAGHAHGDVWALVTMFYWLAEIAIIALLWQAHSICKKLPKEEGPR